MIATLSGDGRNILQMVKNAVKAADGYAIKGVVEYAVKGADRYAIKGVVEYAVKAAIGYAVKAADEYVIKYVAKATVGVEFRRGIFQKGFPDDLYYTKSSGKCQRVEERNFGKASTKFSSPRRRAARGGGRRL